MSFHIVSAAKPRLNRSELAVPGSRPELFEKAGEHLKAAEAYDESGYARQAAQAYVKCGKWEKAAICLEQNIAEESTGGHSDGIKSAAVQKLVRMAGNLFERAELFDRTAFSRDRIDFRLGEHANVIAVFDTVVVDVVKKRAGSGGRRVDDLMR